MMKRACVLALAVVLAAPSANAQEDPPKHKKKIHLGAKLAGGATYRSLYSSSLTAGTIDLGLGAEFASGALYGTFAVALGSTKYGLGTQMYSFGPSWEFRFDRVRFGVGAQLGYLQIARVTQPDHPFGAFVSGAHVFLTVDVFAVEDHAVYLGAKLSADAVQSNDADAAFIGGPTIFAGLRF